MSDKVDEERERPRGIDAVIWALEHVQDLLSVVVGVMLVALAVVVLVMGVVGFFRDVMNGPVETAVIILLDRVLLVLILVEIVHTVVLSLRAHHLVTQPLLAVGLVAVIRKVLFVLSTEAPVSNAELGLLIGMIAVFVAALILVSRYEQAEVNAEGLPPTPRSPGTRYAGRSSATWGRTGPTARSSARGTRGRRG